MLLKSKWVNLEFIVKKWAMTLMMVEDFVKLKSKTQSFKPKLILLALLYMLKSHGVRFCTTLTMQFKFGTHQIYFVIREITNYLSTNI